MEHSVVVPEFEPLPTWEEIPEGYVHRDVADVATDADDNVYLLTRYDPRVIVYDSAGTFLRSWGEDVLSARPHGITVGPDNHVYVVDEQDQTVQRWTPEGERVAVIGESGVRSDTGHVPEGTIRQRIESIERGGPPFNSPTAVAITDAGDIFVADGYGNARVHHFKGDGSLVKSWGTPGNGPGEFHVPHHIVLDNQGRLLVCDRENDRIQVFSQDGDFIQEWTDVQRPAAAAVDREGLVYVPELARPKGDYSFRNGEIDERKPNRMTILDGETGKVVRRLALTSGEDPCAPGNFAAPHGITIDTHGNLYVAEVTYSMYVMAGPAVGAAFGVYVGDDCHTIQKFARCSAHGHDGASNVARIEKPSV